MVVVVRFIMVVYCFGSIYKIEPATGTINEQAFHSLPGADPR